MIGLSSVSHIYIGLQQAGGHVRNISASKNLQNDFVRASVFAKSFGTEASLQKDAPASENKEYVAFSGHFLFLVSCICTSYVMKTVHFFRLLFMLEF